MKISKSIKLWVPIIIIAIVFHSQMFVTAKAETTSVVGTMVDAAMHEVTVHTNTGKNVIISKTEKVRLGNGNITIGDKIKVIYKKSGSKKKAVKISLITKAKKVVGYVQEDTSMNVLFIKTNKGKKYQFATENAYFETIDGLVIGDKVCIYYYKKGFAAMVEEQI